MRIKVRRSVRRRKAHPDGAINHSIVFLSCGHDAAEGRYEIDKLGNIKLVYKDVFKQPFFCAATDQMKSATNELGGVFR